MFLISVLEDKLKILPEEFDSNTTDILILRINEKYINKVIPDIGLCVAFYDFLEVNDPYIYPAEGASHQYVKFRLVIFKPFVGEILTGRVLQCTPEGVTVTLEFFDDIWIPSYSLQVPSEYEDKCWVWRYDEEQAFKIECGDMIRFKVMAINFSKVITTARGIKATTTTTLDQGSNIPTTELLQRTKLSGNNDVNILEDSVPPLLRRRSRSIDISIYDESPPAMKVIGSANEEGHGLISWWIS